MSWFSKSKAEPGWMVISVGPETIKWAHVAHFGRDKPLVSLWSYARQGDEGVSLQGISKDADFDRYQCASLLKPGEYQILLVDAPTVASDELKGAIRWKIKDLIDYHVDDATVDVLDIPASSGKNHSMYAVAARNELLQRQIKEFDEAGIPLTVIDIPEMAQRNMSSLFAEGDRAVAMLSFDSAGGLFTVTQGGELYLARKIEVSWAQLANENEGQRQHYFERVATELQRSLDHFDRQFNHLTLVGLLLAPLPQDVGLAGYLTSNLGVPVRSVDVTEVMDLPPESGMSEDEQWQLFHVLGAGLRREEKAL